jgi:signal transduction histidine kinase/DNA-binding response OmpR family regulator
MAKRWTDQLSLRSKSTLVVLAVVATGLLTVALVGVGQMRRLVSAEALRTVNAMAQGLGHAAELALAVHDERELSRLANRFMRDDQILLVAIYGNNGKLITKAVRNPAIWDRYIHGRIDGDDILLGEQVVELSATDNEFSVDAPDDTRLPDQYIESAQKHGIVGRVVIGLSTASAIQARREQTQLTAISTAAAAALSVVLVYVLVGAWTRRLSTLVLASKRISDGDFDYCVDEGRDDEIGRLSSAYDRMRRAIRQRDAELRAFNETLQQQVLERTRSLEEALHAAQAADQAKSRFLATMSHELRTPLNGVVGMVDLLRGTPLDLTQQRYAQVAHNSADALLSVINDILDFSKIEAGRMELESLPFDPCGMIEDLIETASLAAPRKGLELSCSIQPDLPAQVIGDLGRLRQILINLINNAVKFTERGGIVLRAELDNQDAHSVVVRFSVTDTGIGIPADRLGRLFQSFSQVDASTTRKYGGTGLGLAISKRLAELMDGSIGVESEVGKGSTFWFTARFLTTGANAPATTLPSPSSAAAQAIPPAIPGRTLHVLLAEDDEINQMVASEILTRAGFLCSIVDNGRGAFESARTNAYDAILMDCQMPEMDGFETTAAIRRYEAQSGRNFRIPIIALTANAIEGDREACLAAGMDEYCSKPIDPAHLVRTIHALTAAAPRPAAEPQPPTAAPDAPPPPSFPLDAAAPPMDIRELHARCLSNAAFATRLLTRFQQRVATDLEQLSQTVREHKLEDAARLAHAMKGSAGNLSANTLRDVAIEIEQFSRAGDATLADDALKRLHHEVARCVAFIPEAIAALAKNELTRTSAPDA